MGQAISVYIVSGYHMLRGMFCTFLSGKGGMTVFGEAADGETAYREIMRLRPQLVLLDIDLPGIPGLILTERIMAGLPATRIIAITEKPEETWLIEFLRLGGKGYLSDCRSEAEIARAFQKVMAGKLYLEDNGMQLLAEHVCQDRRIPAKVAGDDIPPQVLSERERQVLHLFVRGYNSTDISSILLISISTVGTHIRNIREKLQLEHKADLMEYAMKHQLYDDWE